MIHNGTVPRVDEKKLKYVNFVDYSIVKSDEWYARTVSS